MDIKSNIKARGKKLTEVSDMLGITPSALTQQIKADSLTLVKLKKIADFLDISLSELLNDGEDKSTSALVCPHCGKPISVRLE